MSPVALGGESVLEENRLIVVGDGGQGDLQTHRTQKQKSVEHTVEEHLVFGYVALQFKIGLLRFRDASLGACQQNRGEAAAELGVVAEIHPRFQLRVIGGIGDAILNDGEEGVDQRGDPPCPFGDLGIVQPASLRDWLWNSS